MSIFRELLAKQDKPESQFKIVGVSGDGKWFRLSNETATAVANVKNGVNKGFITEKDDILTLTGKGRAFPGNPVLTPDGKQIKVTAFTDREEVKPTITWNTTI